jgi:hypothetical protein
VSVEALGHQRARALLAAYAVDAVDSIERELVEAHVSRCVDCANEVASLRVAAARLDAAQERPPARLWDAIQRRVRTPDARPVAVGSGGIVTRTRRAQRSDLRTDAEVLTLTAEATHQLLWIETELDAVAIVAKLIEDLGGAVVPADAAPDAIPDAIPVDISFGACQPLAPAAPAMSVARLHLEEVLPGVLEDARRAVAIVRNRRRLR